MALMLIADDNKQISSILEGYAKKEGYNTILAFDGEETLDKFETYHPNVILLDVMMPKLDGFHVCRKIRESSDVPIIMVTARGEDFEKIMGLDTGADDYIVKPFSPGEVMARVRAVMRRIDKRDLKESHTFQFDNLMIQLDTYNVYVGEHKVSLTKKEADILWTLATNRERVFSRDTLLDMLWGYDYYGDLRTVDTHIKRLRAKLDTRSHPGWEIKTIWGVGYKFEAVGYEA